ncbi:8-amino-7-oxononanoate synthase [Lentisphaera profundi]|uniref:8-amino-7-ketopelargonate synthase n=1 Tax=Lentisphaera profundi TaxID=1658616 RepID=A0ABY7VXS9_9BACT|nr:8-amino-7-oxononanoate synthase [Lentisphaera profundi]WDE97509.1 8-amino-7-oxononanoate synthase [Lentisphaera profundi]
MYENKIFEDKLKKLEKEKLLRQETVYEYSHDVEYISDGKVLINFSSNSYLGMHRDSRIIKASKEAVEAMGTSSIASRLVCGTLPIHAELEKKIAQWKGSEAAMVLNSGFQANLGIIQALANKDSLILADKLVHASIIDGIRLSNAKFQRFHHNDMDSLNRLLERYSDIEHKIIISETVFSMDGDKAPLEGLIKLSKKHGAFLYLDDAHGAGVYGSKGRGPTAEVEGVDLLLGTFSKAFGSFGAYACMSETLKKYLVNSCRSYIYSTALPPAVIAANLKAVELLDQQEYESKQKMLIERCSRVRDVLKNKGYKVVDGEGPIIAIIIGEEHAALQKSKELLVKGFLVPAIRPPTVPKGTSRLRLTLSSLHSDKQVKYLLNLF